MTVDNGDDGRQPSVAGGTISGVDSDPDDYLGTENQLICGCAGPCKVTPDIIIAESKHKCHEIGCGL